MHGFVVGDQVVSESIIDLHPLDGHEDERRPPTVPVGAKYECPIGVMFDDGY